MRLVVRVGEHTLCHLCHAREAKQRRYVSGVGLWGEERGGVDVRAASCRVQGFCCLHLQHRRNPRATRDETDRGELVLSDGSAKHGALELKGVPGLEVVDVLGHFAIRVALHHQLEIADGGVRWCVRPDDSSSCAVRLLLANESANEQIGGHVHARGGKRIIEDEAHEAAVVRLWDHTPHSEGRPRGLAHRWRMLCCLLLEPLPEPPILWADTRAHISISGACRTLDVGCGISCEGNRADRSIRRT